MYGSGPHTSIPSGTVSMRVRGCLGNTTGPAEAAASSTRPTVSASSAASARCSVRTA